MTIVSDRDSLFTRKFWKSIFQVLVTQLKMVTADILQTDGQTDRLSGVAKNIRHIICADTPRCWSFMLLVVEFVRNNSVHASTSYNPLYVSVSIDLCTSLTILRSGSEIDGGRSPIGLLMSILLLLRNRSASFSRRDWMSYDMCVMQ